MKQISLIVVLVLLVASALTACTAKPALTEKEAIASAKREAALRGWAQVEVAGARFEDDHWKVALWKVPAAPGTDAIIVLTKEGKFVRLIPGK